MRTFLPQSSIHVLHRATAKAFVLLLLVFLHNNNGNHVVTALSMADPSAARAPGGPRAQYNGGAGVGRLVIDKEGREEQWECHYDMVLVERIQGRPPAESGLFIPQDDLPRLHLSRVISMGRGKEEENGRTAPMPQIQVGDIVIAKNPWGIGPKDEETADGKKLSFMRSQDIAAVVTGGIVLDEED